MFILLFLWVMVLCGVALASDTSKISNKTKTVSDAGQVKGCYIGAYLGGGARDQSSISIKEFNQKTGKKHAIFSRYVDIKDSKSNNHLTWAGNVKNNGAMPLFIYDPVDGLDKVKKTDLEYFASKCRALDIPVFIVFGHEMNLPTYPWGQQPTAYKAQFKTVAETFHRIAPKVKMCWVPNQNWGYPWTRKKYTGDGYTEYYPEGVGVYGPYVDWVGLNFYERDWDEDNKIPDHMFTSNILNGQNNVNFYQKFAVLKHKPMLISEIGSFDPNKDPTTATKRMPLTYSAQKVFNNKWLSQIYNSNILRKSFPLINAICYFNVCKSEGLDTKGHKFSNITTDYRIYSYTAYKNLVHGAYFIGAQDFTPPTVVNSNPSTNAWVPGNKTILVYFSENIKIGQVFKGINVKTSTGIMVPTFKSIKNNVLTIIKSTGDQPGTRYVFNLPPGCVLDLADNKLTTAFKSSFMVEKV